MKQIFGKHALVTAFAVLALFLTAQAVQAQAVVDPGGVGRHLLFGYWTTEGRDTYIAIQYPTGVQETPGPEAETGVTVIVRGGGVPGFADETEGADVGQSEELAMFNTCLRPGETWTAALTQAEGGGSSLTVRNAGSCDDRVDTTDEEVRAPADIDLPPEPGVSVALDAQMGYIEAYTTAFSIVDPAATSTPSTRRRDLSGIAYLVSPGDGFSSTVNATAVICASGTQPPCPGDQINVALGDGDTKRRLFGRWVTDPSIGAMTDVVLTFPGAHPLNAQTVDDDGEAMTVTDPVSMYVFNEEGSISSDNDEEGTEKNNVLNAHNVDLGQAVNKCSFTRMGAETTVDCNGTTLGKFKDTAGIFRIFNNTLDDISADEDGEETTGFGDAARTPAEALPVIGTVFSVFEVDGMSYDQAVPIQWTDVD